MTEWKQAVFLAIPDAAEEAFLFLPTDDGKWRLPLFDVEHYMFQMQKLQAMMRERFQVDMSILRWLTSHKQESETEKLFWIIALIETHQGEIKIPEGAVWFNAESIRSLPLAEEWQREGLLEALASFKQAEPELRPPWFRKGWMQKARRWIKQELETQGYQVTGEIEQFKHWGLSALLRVQSNQGLVYFKVANRFPLFAHEPRIMQHLSQVFPKYMPPVIAVQEEERWMLSLDYGKMIWEANPDKAMLSRIAREYARLQQETNKPEVQKALEAAGCFNRRLHVLEAQIEPMYADEIPYAALNAEEQSAWKASESKLKDLCQRLASYQIPETLVHGDFHPGNVALHNDDFLIFDWTDACISHPFFDLPIFLDNLGDENPEEIRKAYLAEWQAYESMERLEEAYRLAEVAAMLHQVISYQGIHNGVEIGQRSIWAGSVVYFIRNILKTLPALNI